MPGCTRKRRLAMMIWTNYPPSGKDTLAICSYVVCDMCLSDGATCIKRKIEEGCRDLRYDVLAWPHR